MRKIGGRRPEKKLPAVVIIFNDVHCEIQPPLLL
jgi:hypothetical protein